MSKNARYYLNPKGEFIIENYHLAKPFSSFFPGIAGTWGIPIWVFYVNRGQAITSFGIKDKDHPIMEFRPANKAYYLTSLIGFRTFIKLRTANRTVFYDAFHNGITSKGFDIENRMIINPCQLELNEINRTLGLEVDIEYFTIPNDDYGALARRLTIRNISRTGKGLEIMDGMPQVIPYGLTNMFLKKLSRTIEAWMCVENLENNAPYFCLKVDPTDRPEVIHIRGGNFYLAFDKRGLIRPITDPQAVFGQSGDFSYPRTFLDKENFSYPKGQLTRSRTPCGMAFRKISLKRGASCSINSIMGNMDSPATLNRALKRIADESYLSAKKKENQGLIAGLSSAVFTRSSSQKFDLYCAQTFLDNIMRGGWPISVEHSLGLTHIHVFARKHGDPERDYNKYLIEPTYFSQGNGNFRDINQNRRCDIWFNPDLKDENILTFFNLLQTDGYNPLVIKPARFVFNKKRGVIEKFFDKEGAAGIGRLLENSFTPGELFSFIEHDGIKLSGKKQDFLSDILANSERYEDAEHGEGFWTDHWHYCLDSLESYLFLYPEDLKNILIEEEGFTFFDNSEYVKPRSERYILRNGRVWQFHSVGHSHDKFVLIRQRREFQHISRTENGLGKICRSTLMAKMLTVIANKFAGLDPFGVGIEMEADKPNWYDSLNGLPGLLGSSVCETFELKRWIVFLEDSLKKIGLKDDYKISLPAEVCDLLEELFKLCEGGLKELAFWDSSHTLKEHYRKKTLMGFSGDTKQLSLKRLSSIFRGFLIKIETGLRKAYDGRKKLYYSYFINEVTDYEIIDKKHSFVRPLGFKQRPLPLFLEAMVHYLRTADSADAVKGIYQSVRKSALFDERLKMYKVCASLEGTPEEIGRCRVFTPGWLENESVWLHMEYKYILEILKKGLYKEFFEDMLNVLIPFQPPDRYGRSVLENSSFIVSSAFPQEGLHGTGFVARLSGSTAEFINIWLIMCAGHRPFYIGEDGRLRLEFKPILASWLFTERAKDGFEKNTFAFKFLNKTLVVYHNAKRKDTFGANGARITEVSLKPLGRDEVVIDSAEIPAPYSRDIRDGKIERIDIYLS